MNRWKEASVLATAEAALERARKEVQLQEARVLKMRREAQMDNNERAKLQKTREIQKQLQILEKREREESEKRKELEREVEAMREEKLRKEEEEQTRKRQEEQFAREQHMQKMVARMAELERIRAERTLLESKMVEYEAYTRVTEELQNQKALQSRTEFTQRAQQYGALIANEIQRLDNSGTGSSSSTPNISIAEDVIRFRHEERLRQQQALEENILRMKNRKEEIDRELTSISDKRKEIQSAFRREEELQGNGNKSSDEGKRVLRKKVSFADEVVARSLSRQTTRRIPIKDAPSSLQSETLSSGPSSGRSGTTDASEPDADDDEIDGVEDDDLLRRLHDKTKHAETRINVIRDSLNRTKREYEEEVRALQMHTSPQQHDYAESSPFPVSFLDPIYSREQFLEALRPDRKRLYEDMEKIVVEDVFHRPFNRLDAVVKMLVDEDSSLNMEELLNLDHEGSEVMRQLVDGVNQVIAGDGRIHSNVDAFFSMALTPQQVSEALRRLIAATDVKRVSAEEVATAQRAWARRNDILRRQMLWSVLRKASNSIFQTWIDDTVEEVVRSMAESEQTHDRVCGQIVRRLCVSALRGAYEFPHMNTDLNLRGLFELSRESENATSQFRRLLEDRARIRSGLPQTSPLAESILDHLAIIESTQRTSRRIPCVGGNGVQHEPEMLATSHSDNRAEVPITLTISMVPRMKQRRLQSGGSRSNARRNGEESAKESQGIGYGDGWLGAHGEFDSYSEMKQAYYFQYIRHDTASVAQIDEIYYTPLRAGISSMKVWEIDVNKLTGDLKADQDDVMYSYVPRSTVEQHWHHSPQFQAMASSPNNQVAFLSMSPNAWFLLLVSRGGDCFVFDLRRLFPLLIRKFTLPVDANGPTPVPSMAAHRKKKGATDSSRPTQSPDPFKSIQWSYDSTQILVTTNDSVHLFALQSEQQLTGTKNILKSIIAQEDDDSDDDTMHPVLPTGTREAFGVMPLSSQVTQASVSAIRSKSNIRYKIQPAPVSRLFSMEVPTQAVGASEQDAPAEDGDNPTPAAHRSNHVSAGPLHRLACGAFHPHLTIGGSQPCFMIGSLSGTILKINSPNHRFVLTGVSREERSVGREVPSDYLEIPHPHLWTGEPAPPSQKKKVGKLAKQSSKPPRQDTTGSRLLRPRSMFSLSAPGNSTSELPFTLEEFRGHSAPILAIETMTTTQNKKQTPASKGGSSILSQTLSSSEIVDEVVVSVDRDGHIKLWEYHPRNVSMFGFWTPVASYSLDLLDRSVEYIVDEAAMEQYYLGGTEENRSNGDDILGRLFPDRSISLFTREVYDLPRHILTREPPRLESAEVDGSIRPGLTVEYLLHADEVQKLNKVRSSKKKSMAKFEVHRVLRHGGVHLLAHQSGPALLHEHQGILAGVKVTPSRTNMVVAIHFPSTNVLRFQALALHVDKSLKLVWTNLRIDLQLEQNEQPPAWEVSRVVNDTGSDYLYVLQRGKLKVWSVSTGLIVPTQGQPWIEKFYPGPDRDLLACSRYDDRIVMSNTGSSTALLIDLASARPLVRPLQPMAQRYARGRIQTTPWELRVSEPAFAPIPGNWRKWIRNDLIGNYVLSKVMKGSTLLRGVRNSEE